LGWLYLLIPLHSLMRRPLQPVEYFVEGIRSGDRVVLGQAITLIESTRPEHQERASEVIGALLAAPQTNTSYRIALTGAPGAGKSTLIESLGMHLVERGHRVAVLAIDPSSSLSKGSILGDKTRMERLSAHPAAFIRPSPAGDSLGGVARKTRETLLLVEAAGYDTILIETVGVGQSEFAAHRMADAFALVLLPGAGDELQGIKRGIVEMADVLIVNKADGDRVRLAEQARTHYQQATHLLPPSDSGWSPVVCLCSAVEQTGIEAMWQHLTDYRAHTQKSGFFEQKRRDQARFWFREALQQGLEQWFFGDASVQQTLPELEAAVTAGQLSPFAAAQRLLQLKINPKT
jgi:LAO/AO transport system kinase